MCAETRGCARRFTKKTTTANSFVIRYRKIVSESVPVDIFVPCLHYDSESLGRHTFSLATSPQLNMFLVIETPEEYVLSLSWNRRLTPTEGQRGDENLFQMALPALPRRF